METNKDTQLRIIRGYSKESDIIICFWQRLKGRQRSGDKKLYSKKERWLQVCHDWKLLTWEAGWGLIRSEASHMTGLGAIFGFLWLVLSWKLTVTDWSVLTSLGQLLQSLWFGLLGQLMQKLWCSCVRVLLTYMVCSLSTCIFMFPVCTKWY